MFDSVEDIKKNNKVRSVIICSLVPGIFCAGRLFFFFTVKIPFSLFLSQLYYIGCPLVMHYFMCNILY